MSESSSHTSPLAAIVARLARGSAAAVLLKVGSSAMALVIAWLLARLLGPAGFGIYAFVTSLAVLFATLGTLGVPTLFVREIAILRSQERWAELRGLLRWGAWVGLGGLVASVPLLLGIGWWVERGDPRPASAVALGLGALTAVAMGAVTLAGTVPRGLGRVVRGVVPDLLVRYGILTGLLFGLWQTRGTVPVETALLVHLVAAATAASLALGFALADRPAQIRGVAPRSDHSQWLRASLGMSLAGAVIIINGQIDVVMVKALSSAEATGLYGVASRLASVLTLLLVAANIALPPVIAPLWASQNRRRVEQVLAISTAALVVVGLGAALVLIGARTTVLGWMGPEFLSAERVVIFLTVANLVALAAGPVQQTLIMVGQERAFALTAAVPTALNIGLNALFIPRWGPEGAAAATGIAVGAQALLQSITLERRAGIRPPLRFVAGMLGARLLAREPR